MFHVEQKPSEEIPRDGSLEKLEFFERDRKSTRLNSSHGYISYAVFCLKKKKKKMTHYIIHHPEPRSTVHDHHEYSPLYLLNSQHLIIYDTCTVRISHYVLFYICLEGLY